MPERRSMNCSDHASSPIGVSLVVVTFNRAEELIRLLRSLEATLARPDVELVLVDDGSTDGTIERVSSLLEPFRDRAQIVAQGKAGPGVGRNRGILSAHGKVVVFLDTDCVVQPGWLDALVAPFENPAVGVVGGPDRSGPDDPLLTRIMDYLMTSFLTTGGVRGAKRTRGGSYHPRSFNMAARREAAIAVGGFPTIWYGEDILFSWRLREKGWELAFAPDGWVYHLRRTTIRGWARQLYRMGRARWWMGRHDRKLLEPIYLMPVVECGIGMCALACLLIGGFYQWVGVGIVGLAFLYLTAIALDGWRRVGDVLAVLGVPLMFMVRETAYALGSLAGLVTPIPDLTGGLSPVKEAA